MPRNVRALELLAPAKDLICGKEAILHGADAVYIGAPKFSARSSAGNSLEDIEALVRFAQPFHVRIYVALNTLFYDEELPEVESLIWKLWNIGVDALIVQDMGILQLNLPPIPLHASTQTDNRSVEKNQFLEAVGFNRVVLARELNLEQIQSIATTTSIQLECFVHGALCVSYSGQCYMSQALSGRSANRGACAQYCRLPYDVLDADENVLMRQKHVLSLRDLNRTTELEALIDAGVTSFKIEGRLKGLSYVKNITAWYRNKLDEIIKRRTDLCAASSGSVRLSFEPDPYKSFNRGFTTYFLRGREPFMTNPDTPKSLGEPVGAIQSVEKDFFSMKQTHSFSNGDGVGYIGHDGTFEGFRINRAEAMRLYPAGNPSIKPGMQLYRNWNQAFEHQLERESAQRTIPVTLLCRETPFGFALEMNDAEGHCAVIAWSQDKNTANKPQQDRVRVELTKLGNTPYQAEQCLCKWSGEWFVPVSVWAEKRRLIVQKMQMTRNLANRKERRAAVKAGVAYPQSSLLYTGNVLNALSKSFYQIHGVEVLEDAYESTSRSPKAGDVLMFNKFCLKYELGACPVHQAGGKTRNNPEKTRNDSGKMLYEPEKTLREPVKTLKEPLTLRFGKQSVRLQFDCRKCEMQLVLDD